MTEDSRPRVAVWFAPSPRGARALSSALLSLALVGAAACGERGPGEGEAREAPPATVAVLDSFLVELGGVPTARLDRAQRWRMISSTWAGLPPPGYTRDSLPEPGSHAAALMQAYCEQCHWMPSPRMHAAAEWPLLMRRMVLRAGTVRERMGGPLTAEILGNTRLLEGMSAGSIPSDEEVETLVTYLQSHALPVAKEGEVGEGPGARLYVDRCSTCHETPSPAAYTPSGWEPVVARMVRNMELQGVRPLTREEIDGILSYLRNRERS